MDACDRGRLLYKLADLMERDRQYLASLETLVSSVSNNRLALLMKTGTVRICSLIKWFAIQMPGIMEVQNSDHHWVNGLLFTPPFEYWSVIQMPSTMVPGI